MNIKILTLPGIPSRRMEMNPAAIGWMALLFMMMGQSTLTSFSKVLTAYFTPLSLLFFSELLTVVFAALSFGFIPLIRSLMRLERAILIPLISVGLLNSFLAQMLWFTGLQFTSAANAELFLRTDIVFTIVLATLILKEKHSEQTILSAGVVMGGVLLIGLDGLINGVQLHWGDLLIILAAWIFACGNFIVKKFLYTVPAELIVFARSSTALLLFFLLSPFMEVTLTQEFALLPVSAFAVLIGFGLLARFLPLFCYYEAVERLPISAISIVSTLSIVTSLGFIRLYLGEPLQWFQMLGALLIVSGAVMSQVTIAPTSHWHWPHFFHRKEEKMTMPGGAGMPTVMPRE